MTVELSKLAQSEMRRLNGTHWGFTPLPDALWEEISSNPELRNAIAGANEQRDASFFQHVAWIAQVYPKRYAVSVEQIEAAKAQWEADKQAAIARLTGSSILLMIDMGSLPRREATTPDDIESYRLRGRFQTPEGRRFLIEVSSRDPELERHGTGPMYCSEFEDLDEEEQQRTHQSVGILKGNTPNLKHADLGAYTKSGLLRVINRNFKCYFKSIEIDRYTLNAKDYTSVSPY